MKAKRVSAIIFLILLFVISLWGMISFVASEINHKHNLKMWSDEIGIISNQHSSDVKDLKYGFGTIGQNGCGAVAIYNIMLLENKKTPLPNIIKAMDGGQYFFGLLGTKPTQMMRYLKAQGYSVLLHKDKSKFDEWAQISDYAIYIYAGFSGGHYTLLVPNGDSTFHSINPNKSVVTIKNLLESHGDEPVNLLMTISK